MLVASLDIDDHLELLLRGHELRLDIAVSCAHLLSCPLRMHLEGRMAGLNGHDVFFVDGLVLHWDVLVAQILGSVQALGRRLGEVRFRILFIGAVQALLLE